ncbi:MAG: hypothetical protein LBN03_01775 [Bifidobacteriaceae bacterium]|nr:hypothetical protein [Bifidobacteriaceae bacterium]
MSVSCRRWSIMVQIFQKYMPFATTHGVCVMRNMPFVTTHGDNSKNRFNLYD